MPSTALWKDLSDDVLPRAPRPTAASSHCNRKQPLRNLPGSRRYDGGVVCVTHPVLQAGDAPQHSEDDTVAVAGATTNTRQTCNHQPSLRDIPERVK